MIRKRITLETESAWSNKVSNAVIGIAVDEEAKTVELCQFKGANLELKQFTDAVFMHEEVLRLTAKYLREGRVKNFDIEEYRGDSGCTESKLVIEQGHQSGIPWLITTGIFKVSCFGKVNLKDEIFRDPIYIGDLVELVNSAVRLNGIEPGFKKYLNNLFSLSKGDLEEVKAEIFKEIEVKEPWWCKKYAEPMDFRDVPNAAQWIEKIEAEERKEAEEKEERAEYITTRRNRPRRERPRRREAEIQVQEVVEEEE